MSDRIDLERKRTTVDDFQDDPTEGPAKTARALAHQGEDLDLDIADDGPSYGATAWQRGQVPEHAVFVLTRVECGPQTTDNSGAPSASTDAVLSFRANIAVGNDSGAAKDLNGLNMPDMLAMLDSLTPLRRDSLLAAAANSPLNLGIERMKYAREVVDRRLLPSPGPGDLRLTGQVDAAADFIAGSFMEVAKAVNADARSHIARLLLALNEAGETNPDHVAYVLATVHHEANFGRSMTEFASGRAYEGRKDLGNTNVGDGVLYKGRGYVQITGRHHYEHYSKVTSTDLVANPNRATEPAIAATIAVHGMMNGGFTGRRLSDYDQEPDGFDFVRARQVVNGMDRAENIAGYAKRYRALMGT